VEEEEVEQMGAFSVALKEGRDRSSRLMDLRRRDFEDVGVRGGEEEIDVRMAGERGEGFFAVVLLVLVVVVPLMVRSGKECAGLNVAALRCSLIVSSVGITHVLFESVPAGEELKVARTGLGMGG
jgi:hypothetical protein